MCEPRGSSPWVSMREPRGSSPWCDAPRRGRRDCLPRLVGPRGGEHVHRAGSSENARRAKPGPCVPPGPQYTGKRGQKPNRRSNRETARRGDQLDMHLLYGEFPDRFTTGYLSLWERSGSQARERALRGMVFSVRSVRVVSSACRENRVWSLIAVRSNRPRAACDICLSLLPITAECRERLVRPCRSDFSLRPIRADSRHSRAVFILHTSSFQTSPRNQATRCATKGTLLRGGE